MRALKRIVILCLTVFAMVVLTSCEAEKSHQKTTEKMTVQIAVMGNPEDFYASYLDGIVAATADIQKEYADTGYLFEVDFFNDESNYEEGMKIADQLLNNDDLIAVIGSRNMEISSGTAHIFDEYGKVFIAPYDMYDSVCADNYYDFVFSMCSSAESTGILLRKAAEQGNARKWAACYTTREFEREEMVGFVNYSGYNTEIVDCVSIDEIMRDFDTVYEKWKLLGVEGVAFFVKELEGHSVLKKLKERNPNLLCAGDILFDDSLMMEADEAFETAMKNFIIADAFYLDENDEKENQKVDEIAQTYLREKGVRIDYWYLQGYNAVRMLCDTVVKNKTTDPKAIAEALHANGYDGLMQKFQFDVRGVQTKVPDYYHIYTPEGTWKKYIAR